MNTPMKLVVGALAIVGGALVTSVIASRFITVSLYSPYLPQYDLIAINGSTIWALLAKGGGEVPPQTTKSLPFPVGVRVYWGRKPSIAEMAFEGLTGEAFDLTQVLKG